MVSEMWKIGNNLTLEKMALHFFVYINKLYKTVQKNYKAQE